MVDTSMMMKQDESCFVGRDKELDVVRAAASLLERGASSVVAVSGWPWIGKTAFLRHASSVCVPPDGTLTPVVLSGGGIGGFDPFAVAEELYRAVRRPPSSTKALDEPWREDRGAAASLLRGAAGDAAALTTQEGIRLPVSLAETLASESGRRLLVFMDDAAPPLADLAAERAAQGGSVTWIVALPGPPVHPGVQSVPLAPLETEAASRLLAVSMSRHGIALAPEVRDTPDVLGGIPGCIRQAAAAARLSGITAFEDVDSFLRFAAGALADGFLAAYQRRVLLGAAARENGFLLELMTHLFSRRGRPGDARELAREMLKEESEITPALDSLAQRGLVECRWGRWLMTSPANMADFCRLQWRMAVEGSSRSEAVGRLVLEMKRRRNRLDGEAVRRRNVSELASFLRSWAGQTVPRSLFDAERFKELIPAADADALAVLSRKDRGRLVLPPVVDAWPEDFPGSDQIPAHAVDLLALTDSGDERERWLAVDVRLHAAEVTAADVAGFETRCRILQNRLDLDAGRLTGWIVSGGAFSNEAAALIKKHHFWSSGPDQLGCLRQAAGFERPLQFVLPAAPAAAADYTFQLTIPARTDTELVAARALEQVAESLAFDEIAVGQIKMALVEACLNAFEHGKSEDRSVFLAFRVKPDRLQIDVYNKGQAFIPERLAAPRIEEKLGAARKRGWGLSIIKELMDEVEFVPQIEGTLLRLTKYLTPSAREANHA